MNDKFTVLSLGWGIQSFALAAMVALGKLEPINAAIHADTTHESKLTYEFAARWTGWLEEHGVRVMTVWPRVKPDPANFYNRVAIPAYYPASNNKRAGMLNRECTNNWKRRNIKRWLQENRHDESVEQWLGISLDEFQRMKDSDVKYIKNRWPLIDLRMTRNDCINWLEKHGLEVPTKSACTFCPYHSKAEWWRIKQTPEDWREAVAVDKVIRKVRPPYDLFVHSSRKPLEEVDLRTQEEKGQLSLFENDECSGICFV